MGAGAVTSTRSAVSTSGAAAGPIDSSKPDAGPPQRVGGRAQPDLGPGGRDQRLGQRADPVGDGGEHRAVVVPAAARAGVAGGRRGGEHGSGPLGSSAASAGMVAARDSSSARPA